MPANLRHFAIEADDVERARRFYETVFGWIFKPFGPPNFYRIFTDAPGGPAAWGAVQERREKLTGTGNRTFECTIGVDDVRAARAAIESAGGRIVMSEYRIEGVGNLIYFEDTEGNRVGAMQYDPSFLADPS
jgi:predicted enzyme related to lactoylglutathione lyase